MQTRPILIVEDDLAICTLLQALMQHRGYDCDVVRDGDEAIRKLRRNDYAAILLDLMLPGTFGFDVIRFLDAERPAMSSRVIVLTAACPATLRHFDASTIRTVMHKPIDVHELAAHVDACASLDNTLATRAPSPAPI